MSSDLTLTLAGEPVTLLPERGLLWQREATLIVADTHWGKAATFRAAAIPIPGGTTSDDLARLSRAIERTGARRLVVLGDLLHARAGRAEQTFAAIAEWRGRHRLLEILLVRGNHDRGAGDPPETWGFTSVDEPLTMAPFVLKHRPSGGASPDGYTLCGHIHPGVRLFGAGRQHDVLPCFWFGPHTGVLPAFGNFTGLAVVTPSPGDQVVILAGDTLVAREGRSHTEDG